MNKELNIHKDKPIFNEDEDILGRKEIADHLLSFVKKCDTYDNLTVSLQGPWGSGKTSILNLLISKLEKEENIIIYEFNPWNFEDDTSLLRAFLDGLSKKIGNEELSKSILELIDFYNNTFVFNKYINGIVNIGVKTLEQASKDRTIDDIRDEIEDKLRTNNKKVIVIVDDIDRLPAIQIKQLFQMIKKTCNFVCLHYILCMDKRVVLSSLENIQGKNISSKNYLDKIIQVEINIDNPTTDQIENYLFSNLETIYKKYGNQINVDDDRLIEIHNWLGLDDFNIRDINRALNDTVFKLSYFENNIDFIDLVNMSLIETKYTELFDFIREHIDLFVGNSYGKYSNITKEKIIDALNTITSNNGRKVFDYLSVMFPYLYNTTQDGYMGINIDSYRIGNKELLYSYFQNKASATLIGRNTLNEVMENDNDVTAISLIENIISDGKIGDLINKIDKNINKISDKRKILIVEIVIKNLNKINDANNSWLQLSDKSKCIYISLNLLENINKDDYTNFLIRCAKCDELIINSAYIFAAAEANSGYLEFGKSSKSSMELSPEKLKELETSIIKKLRQYIDEDKILNLNNLYIYLLICKKYNQEDFNALIEYINKDKYRLLKVVASFAHSWKGTNGTGYSYKSFDFLKIGINKENVCKIIRSTEFDSLIDNLTTDEIKRLLTLINENNDAIDAELNDKQTSELIKNKKHLYTN